jgi:hypothetical protein
MRLSRHAGLDPASRRRPDESREPSQRLGPGFHREPWIPAFAGMTVLIEEAIYKQTLINVVLLPISWEKGVKDSRIQVIDF